MEKDEKLHKWIEAMTPRRAIDKFFDHATPVDSPDPEEMYTSASASVPPELPESTPLARSSQSSQRSNRKRKSSDEEQLQGNVSKRINAEEINMSPSDSISGTLEFPSQLASPSLVIPERPDLRKKRKMSVTAFTKAILSQESQKTNITLDESSIASELGSPDQARPQRPGRLKNHTSVSDFTETFVKKVATKVIGEKPSFTLDSLSMESAGIPSHLDSPEYIGNQKRGPAAAKRRASSTGFKNILNKRSFEKSDLLEDEQTRISMEYPITSSAMIPEQLVHSGSSRMSPAFESSPSIPLDVHSLIEKTSEEIRSNSPDPEFSEDSDMPELESADEFPPPALTTQFIKRQSLGLPDMAKNSAISVKGKNNTGQSGRFVSQNETLVSSNSSNSTSDVPSMLDSPQEPKEYYRPGHAPSKKRVSVTGFMAALSQKTVDLPPLKSPPRSSTPEASNTVVSTRSRTLRTPVSPRKISSILVEELGKNSRNSSRVYNESLASLKSRSRTIQRPSLEDSVSEETGQIPFRETPSPLEQTGRVTRSSSHAIDKTSASPKRSAMKTPPPELSRDSDESGRSLVNEGPSTSVNKIGVTLRSASRTPEKSWKANSGIIGHAGSERSHSNEAVGLLLNETSPKVTSEQRQASRSSNQIANNSPIASKSSSMNIPRPELYDGEMRDSENVLPMQRKKSLPLIEIMSAILVPDKTKASSVLSSPERRSTRKSLKFDSPTIKDISRTIQPTENDLLLINEVEIEVVPPTDLDTTEEDKEFGGDHSVEEIEGKAEDGLSTRKTTTRLSHESSPYPRKSESTQMSMSNRYPALKNSTVVAGGIAFAGAQLSMSPIVPIKQGVSSRVTSSPRPTTPESPKTVAPSNPKSTSPKNLHKTPSHPSTPAPFARKRTSSMTQSPMFMNVMKSTMKKVISKTVKDQQQLVPAIPAVSTVKKSTTPTQLPSTKGLSVSNPQKGKSLAVSAFDEMSESSDTEWEDAEDVEKFKPSCIRIAFEEVQDRTKDFVPLEKRLMADPIFQAKVKSQRAKLATKKAAEEAIAAAAAAKKAKPQKKQRVVIKKKEKDNIANVTTNKANLRFYARTKVSKDALEAVHGLVGQWFDFTLRQIEKYCVDEGKASLDTWQDCYKVMKRQGLVNNYAEYSGLCHELLMNDECSQLLPSQFPPEFAEWRRQAQNRRT